MRKLTSMRSAAKSEASPEGVEQGARIVAAGAGPAQAKRGHPWVRIALCATCLWLGGTRSALAGGTVVFRNWWYVYVYTNATSGYLTNEQRPVVLADGVTRAAGSNYVVELWAGRYFGDQSEPRMERVATTRLLDGSRAGLFTSGGAADLEVPFLNGGDIALLSVRVWDDRSGSDFETATIRTAVSFDNALGNESPTPTLPKPLVGLPTLRLGGTDAATNPPVLEFWAGWPPAWGPRYSAARSSGVGIVWVRRVGDLMRTNTVDYVTHDLTATDGKEYVRQSGTLTFLPGEALGYFAVPILADGLQGNQVSVGLRLATATTTLGTGTATLDLYDDRPSVRWVSLPEEGSRFIDVRGYGHYRLEHAPTLAAPLWGKAPYGASGGTTDADGRGQQTFLNNAWPEGFYRAVKSP